MTLALTVIEKSFQLKKTHLNALGGKFDLDILSPKVTSLLVLESFNHNLAWQPSWSCDQDNLNKLWFPHPRDSPLKFEFNWLSQCEWFQRINV